METFREFRAAAENCRVLAKGMANPDETRKLMILAMDFEALADADEAAGSAGNAAGARRNG